MQVKVYAKLNLTLNVSDRKNGFHDIDSVAVSVNVFDVVDVVRRQDKNVTVSGIIGINERHNTAYRAACAFIERFCADNPHCGVDIAIQKGIPMGAGMGGSSADAAAVIYCMCSLFGVDVNSSKVHALCAEIGSDVNFMLHGGLARLQGKGDDIVYSFLGAPLYFALTTFEKSMSTAEVYAQFDKLGVKQEFADNSALIYELKEGCPRVFENFNNHLQAATVSLSDYACTYLQFCNEHALSPNMTGSGSAYFIACDSVEYATRAANLLNAYGFKTVVCHSVSEGIEVLNYDIVDS